VPTRLPSEGRSPEAGDSPRSWTVESEIVDSQRESGVHDRGLSEPREAADTEVGGIPPMPHPAFPRVLRVPSAPASAELLGLLLNEFGDQRLKEDPSRIRLLREERSRSDADALRGEEDVGGGGLGHLHTAHLSGEHTPAIRFGGEERGFRHRDFAATEGHGGARLRAFFHAQSVKQPEAPGDAPGPSGLSNPVWTQRAQRDGLYRVRPVAYGPAPSGRETPCVPCIYSGDKQP